MWRRISTLSISNDGWLNRVCLVPQYNAPKLFSSTIYRTSKADVSVYIDMCFIHCITVPFTSPDYPRFISTLRGETQVLSHSGTSSWTGEVWSHCVSELKWWMSFCLVSLSIHDIPKFSNSKCSISIIRCIYTYDKQNVLFINTTSWR